MTSKRGLPITTSPITTNLSGKYCVSDYIKTRVKTEPSNIKNILQEPKEYSYGTALWLFEHLKQICRDLGFLLAELHDDKICTASTCPEMGITHLNLKYLCAAHVGTKNCCAIDYAVHTLEGTVSTLNNSKAFPNNLEIENKNIPKFRTMLRRLYRVLAHAFFHHQATFITFENKTHLCKRVHALALKYQLIESDQLIIPGYRR